MLSDIYYVLIVSLMTERCYPYETVIHRTVIILIFVPPTVGWCFKIRFLRC